MTPRYLHPVIALSGGPYMPTPSTVAVFFEYGDACDFVSAERHERALYIGEPRTDRRASGYRPVEQPSGYESWCAQLTECRGDPMLKRARAA